MHNRTVETATEVRLNLLRHGALSLLAASLAACGAMQVNDANAAVDANPLCTSQPNRPGEPVASECERKAETPWSSEGSKSSEPIDFSGKH